MNIPLVQLRLSTEMDCEVWMLRSDLVHDRIPGNKWWKLKYNMEEMRRRGMDTMLTFGGAFSNHIAATAEAGKEFGFKTIGVIRGEEVNNSTLERAIECGMKLEFVSRELYRQKDHEDVLDALRRKYGDVYFVPEGGSNALAVRGCMELIDSRMDDFDVITVPVGTGGTMAGIVAASKVSEIIGYSALKGGQDLINDVNALLKGELGDEWNTRKYRINADYHFGGYARIKEELLQFTRTFYEEEGIKLDLIYTAKMAYGVIQDIRRGTISAKKICMIHTGGLQGNEGMIKRYKLSKLF